MSKIVIFSGTTEGRTLSEKLSAAEIAHSVCVATEFGEMVMNASPYVKSHMGRMTEEEMTDFFKEEGASLVVDATHPYAAIVTENIRKACETLDVQYLRVARDAAESLAEDGIHRFSDTASCAEALENSTGNVLLTTGSKEVGLFCKREELRGRIIARVLPSEESIRLCRDAGLDGRQILAMFGPFTREMNSLMIREKKISHLVTKSSGKAGGFEEKIQAARENGCQIWLIEPPCQDKGVSVWEAYHTICGIYKKKPEEMAAIEKKPEEAVSFEKKPHLQVTLAGIGMGTEESLTVGVKNRIESADVLLGASRMVKPFENRKKVEPIYLSRDIIPYLENRMQLREDLKAVILFSGDSGMYSGTKKLLDGLRDLKARCKTAEVEIEVLPGISSVSYFASKLGIAYSDTAVESLHGRTRDREYHRYLSHRLKKYKDSFILLSGPEDLPILKECFQEKERTCCYLTLGYQLGYPEESVERYRMDHLPEDLPKGLYICHIRNDNAITKESAAFPAICDEAFLRGKVPMTKADVRHLSIMKLGLNERSILYDVGSGTGSVSVESSMISDQIQVYAFEKKPEAVELMKKNMELFHCQNIELIEGNAPESFEGVVNPTHVFIGGSGGNMKQILQTLINRRVDACCSMTPLRVVINAISLETIAEITDIMSEYEVKDDEIISVQISRSRKAGHYHLMEAQNPVYIASFTLV